MSLASPALAGGFFTTSAKLGSPSPQWIMENPCASFSLTNLEFRLSPLADTSSSAQLSSATQPITYILISEGVSHQYTLS